MIGHKIIYAIKTKLNTIAASRISELKQTAIMDFCKKAQLLRTPENCSKWLLERNIFISPKECKVILDYFFSSGKTGAFIWGKGIDPQQYMYKKILSIFSEINDDSFILEVGPGNLPLFREEKYKNLFYCDFNLQDNGIINFSEHEWGKGLYRKIVKGGWENLSDVRNRLNSQFNSKLDKFDLICGSHSFEHNRQPVKSLREVCNVLKKDGIVALFVPDGDSTWNGNYDKTHTMYLCKDMVDDLFQAAGGFYDVRCEQFRTNMDLLITAKKK